MGKIGGDNMTAKEREEAIDKFVNREIFACQSALINEAFKGELFTLDDVENLYRPFDGKLIDPAICVRCNDSVCCLDRETGECESCFEDNQQPQKIINCFWYYLEHLDELILQPDDATQSAKLFRLIFVETPTYEELLVGTPKIDRVFKLNNASKENCEPDGIRTCDQELKRLLLYR